MVRSTHNPSWRSGWHRQDRSYPGRNFRSEDSERVGLPLTIFQYRLAAEGIASVFWKGFSKKKKKKKM